MKKILMMTLAIAWLAGGVNAQTTPQPAPPTGAKKEPGKKDPTTNPNVPTITRKGGGSKAFANACLLASQNKHDAALKGFVAIWDEIDDDKMKGEVIEQLGSLSLKHAPAKQALQARRDELAAKVGTQPKFTKAFKTLLSMNRALGESSKNDALLMSAAGGEAGIQRFASRATDPMPPSIGSAVIAQRAKDTYEFQKYQAKADAVAFILVETKVAVDEGQAVKDQIAKAEADIADLTEQLGKVEEGSEAEWKLLYNIKMIQSFIENELRPKGESIGRELEYYKVLKTHRDTTKE